MIPSTGVTESDGCRILTPRDQDQIISLLRSRPHHMGVKLDAEDLERRIQFYQNSLNLSSKTQLMLVGYFDKNRDLKAMLGMFLWRSLPHATISELVVARAESMRSPFLEIESGFGACYRRIITMGIDVGVVRFYVLTSVKYFQTWERIRSRRGPTDSRVTRSVEAIIPAGELSKYASFRSIANQKVFKVDTIIFSESVYQRVQNPSVDGKR